jgi:probable rRNA maturation factor
VSAAVEVIDPSGLEQVRGPVADLVEAVLDAEGLSGVVVAFLDEPAIAGLNAHYRGLDEPTDVLSFRYADDASDWHEHSGRPPAGGADLGELAVCPAVVCRYAQEAGSDPGAQLGWAIVHGALHLAGYDHETDNGEMRSREQELLRGLGHLVNDLAIRETAGGCRH